MNIVCIWLQDYSGMPTALREAVAYGSTDITSFVTQHCNKAAEKVSFTSIVMRFMFSFDLANADVACTLHYSYSL